MKNPRDVLAKVVGDVLERFAFMFFETETDLALATPTGTELVATISYRGKETGDVKVMVPQSLCDSMAANVLGVDVSDVERVAGEETLKELVNIIGGAVASALYGDQEVYELSLPEVTKGSPADLSELLRTPCKVIMQVEGLWLYAGLTTKEAVAS